MKLQKNSLKLYIIDHFVMPLKILSISHFSPICTNCRVPNFNSSPFRCAATFAPPPCPATLAPPSPPLRKHSYRLKRCETRYQNKIEFRQQFGLRNWQSRERLFSTNIKVKAHVEHTAEIVYGIN